ncbi:MAG: cell division protein ZapA [Calditrichaceae bacterium]|nr:cell division protein ZapA [Calditrichaceae bacterium]MBN2709866.1 cell division protein ZapA [Calditrichaceae bacterium]RQV92623.1 MAG: cell division protein ZapA [Calditrichota bacterium]
MAPGQIRVNIFGTEYTLLSDGNETFVNEIAQYVDKKMREIDKSSAIKSVNKIAILAALNIAEELYQERDYRNKLLDQLNEEAKNLNESIQDVLSE